jgi:hypothetical protein
MKSPYVSLIGIEPMRLLSYITKRVPKLAGLASIALFAACSDSPSAPSAPSATPQSVESITWRPISSPSTCSTAGFRS